MAKEGVNLGLKIAKLEDLGFTYQKPEESVPTERIDFSMEHKITSGDDDQNIVFILKPRFSTGKKEPKLISEFIFKVVFEVQGLEKLEVKKDEEELEVPDQLIVTLFSIAYSTMRGAFFEKNKGTMAERLILPIIDPKSILEGKKSEE